MATCIDTINQTNTFDVIDGGIDYTFSLSPSTNKIYSITSENNQTYYFNVSVLSSNVVPDIFMTILSESLVVVRTSRISENTVVSVDLPIGEYYVCFRVFIGNFTLKLNVDYVRFSRNVTLEPLMYYGESTTFSIKGTKVPVPCNQPLRYSLEYGKLPTGLTLSTSGFISGTLPIIDTEELTDTPSANLYHKTNGVYEPIGVRYDFYVRLSLLNDLDVFVIKKFCINIVNDWTLTRDIIDKIGVTEQSGIIEYIENKIPNSLCPPCDNEESPISIVYDVKTNIIDSNIQLESVKYINEFEPQDAILLQDINFTPNKDEYINVPDSVDIKTHILDNIDFYQSVGHDRLTLIKFIEGQYKHDFVNGLVHIIVDDSIDVNDPLYKLSTNHIEELRDESMYVNSTYGESIYFKLEVKWKKPL